jgi:hypothetical protein
MAPSCQNISYTPSSHLTSHSFAAVGVATTWGVALHAQTLVAAMGVDTELAAGEGGAAFVYISTCPAIVFQPESRAAAALWTQGAWRWGCSKGLGLLS